MNKALSFMIIGALGSSAVFLYLNNKEKINSKMRSMTRNGMNKIKRVKETLD
jgi:hypothetical protein